MKKYWFIGGIAGLTFSVLSILLIPKIILSINFSFFSSQCQGEQGLGCALMFIPIYPIFCFLVGMLVGWIYGKIKGAKK